MPTKTLQDTIKKLNFYAGPAIWPREVVIEAAKGLLNYQESGLSIAEISHRTSAFDEVIDGARVLVKELMGLGDDYSVLFLSGGASMQFCMVPYNLLPNNGTAAFLDTGRWSDKAIKEAKLFGKTKVVASSKEGGYNFVPKNYLLDNKYAYYHVTTNNTVCGTQMHYIPQTSIPLVADMSSDIFSREMDMTQFDLIYAGAQKNLGPAGTTIVIVKKEILGKVKRAIPTMLDYRTHTKVSMFNTPPVFPIYCCYLSLQWIKKQGIAAIEQRNKAKAALLYAEIDRNGLFEGTSVEADRSLMNVTFRATDVALETTFLEEAEAAGCMGLKGHRSMGGFRASIYNAMDLEGVNVLVDMMKQFEKKHG